MYYFAYGSNLSSRRLKARCPSIDIIGSASLPGHSLRFHKVGGDGSGKGDALLTGNPRDCVFGVLYQLPAAEQTLLDKIEGLGKGYDKQEVVTIASSGEQLSAWTYQATITDAALLPFGWYLNHVLIGAKEFRLPPNYIQAIASTPHRDDPDRERDKLQRQIYL